MHFNLLLWIAHHPIYQNKKHQRLFLISPADIGGAGNAYTPARAGFAGNTYTPANEAADGTTRRHPYGAWLPDA